MINGLGNYDPSQDMGLEGLGSLGDPGIGSVDLGGGVPNTFGGMPGNTRTITDLTQSARQGSGSSPSVQVSGLGGVPRPGPSIAERKTRGSGGSSIEDFFKNQFQEPKDFVKFGTGVLSFLPTPVQPFAQVLSKGLTLGEIGNALQGKGTGIMQTATDALSTFDLGTITKTLADMATKNEPPQ